MLEKNLRKETFYLYIIQIANIVLPLLTIPYFTKIFGTEYYGKLSFAIVISMVSTFIVDFGFNFSAARLIGFNKDSKDELNKIFSNVQLVKLFFFALVSTFGGGVFLLINDDVDGKLFLIGVFSSASSVFMPYWFFQGVGRNSLISLINLIVRVVTICAIFGFVHDTRDVFIAAILQLFSPVAAGVVLFFYMRKEGIALFSSSNISFVYCISLVKESFHNFSASFMTLGFTYLNPLLIKYFLGDSALGVYSLAERIVSVLRQMYMPLMQANFSSICEHYKNNNVLAVTMVVRKIFFIFFVIAIISVIGNYVVGESVFYFLFGIGYNNTEIQHLHMLVSIMILTQFVISLSIILVNLVVIPSGFSFYLKRVYAYSFFIYLLVIFPMIYYGGLNGVAITILFVEFSVVFTLYKFAKLNKLLNFSSKMD
ncbi:oligosaccharide flippase family protein [Pectobacterium aroidearum]|uniref:oligosaccharide flippase family protein n=1 Tax=Pectobacterium aroidearum TaxID=1201031 RepID=UPI002115AE93|nr:oligosaccharide flippase family protein [Pectobacterium aroidearum]UUE43767.1 oligosaccharide flippase family protein [Pectobacterium aroidearum]UUE47988.1 oligosaccharide flippase family protein [Pectobacterium aroidearum]UUE52193.1 oligosaccharide flippase family protein [Pectobacterium aroidearum]UUE60601.1 oligosaccharide flippase family protein [Pectobacterium aroidearum]UUE64824.1 oligosaccharide flippase family protein [Pectobacterium aroidearum]